MTIIKVQPENAVISDQLKENLKWVLEEGGEIFIPGLHVSQTSSTFTYINTDPAFVIEGTYKSKNIKP